MEREQTSVPVGPIAVPEPVGKVVWQDVPLGLGRYRGEYRISQENGDA